MGLAACLSGLTSTSAHKWELKWSGFWSGWVLCGWCAETHPDITSYQHVPGLVVAAVLPVELHGFEEGLHLARLLLQEVWQKDTHS